MAESIPVETSQTATSDDAQTVAQQESPSDFDFSAMFAKTGEPESVEEDDAPDEEISVDERVRALETEKALMKEHAILKERWQKSGVSIPDLEVLQEYNAGEFRKYSALEKTAMLYQLPQMLKLAAESAVEKYKKDNAVEVSTKNPAVVDENSAKFDKARIALEKKFGIINH